MKPPSIGKNNSEIPEVISCDCGHGSTSIRKDHALENALRENAPVCHFRRPGCEDENQGRSPPSGSGFGPRIRAEVVSL